jgi:glycine/D-amino acid oxidase-like deaminating enzyme
MEVIVLGGGLAGMSAAHSVVQAGGRVLVIDKEGFCGGNSTKATSGEPQRPRFWRWIQNRRRE